MFAVTGWSVGGPWALAAAAYLEPARLVHVACIAGGNYGTFGPNWAAKHLNGADALGGRLALHFHAGFRLMYEVVGMSAKHFGRRYAEAIQKAVSASDRDVLADERVFDAFLAASQECFRQGADGLVLDATMLYAAWPFDMTVVQRPVHFWQGSADTLVPEIINRRVADETPGAVWHPVTGGGHFIAVSHADEILAAAAQDLARG
ncbi:alpha/beta fold hydrolase [Mycobacterium antarcticum]|uniref:alpha/beta fold hydrolase n=1 Tax=Mycolicibacterium sp. TUM20985 TaxID=3023370 RepID=UPI00257447DC|nr:alpha/beta hydrolase [Mycolicibacterium sp. TUM20985]